MPLLPPTDAIKDSIANAETAAQKGTTALYDSLNNNDVMSKLAVQPKVFADTTRLQPPPSGAGQPSDARNAHDTFFDLDGWNENPLSSVQLPTYNIRLFMVEDTPLLAHQYANYQEFCDAIGKKQQTTIAATGVSDVNIVSLVIESLPGLNKQTRSMAANKMTLVLKEPMGVSFMSMMAETARELRIRNYSKGYYMLEVSFKAYTPDGNFEFNPCSGEKYAANKGKWLYQVAIKSIETEMNDTGGKYTLQLIPYQQQMYDDNSMTLAENINVTGSKVCDILNNLAIAINESVVYADGYQSKKYEFKFYDLKIGNNVVSVKDFEVSPTKEEFNTKRSNSMDQGAGNSIKAHFAKGTAISDIVELVFANSKHAQLLLLDVTTTEAIKKAETDKKEMRKSVLFKVEVTADYAPGGEDCEYDYANENYIMNYTLHVLPYFTQTPILDHADVTVSQDPKVQVENARMLRENGYLSKKYDYLFTGLNTEVLSLDIKFKMDWHASLPRILGVGTSTESNAVGPMKEVKTPQQLIMDQRDELKKNQEIYRRREDKKAAAEHELAAIKSLGTDPNKPKDYDDKLKKAEQALKEIVEDKEDEAKAATADAERRRIQLELDKKFKDLQKTGLDSRATKQTDDERGGSHRFAEEVLETPRSEQRNALVISTQQSNADTRLITSGAIADQKSGDRSVYGAVLNQLYSGLEYQLMNIKMEIKGDPYWLGATNMERSFLTNKMPPFTQIRLTESEQIDIDQPNYARGDVMFLVQFKYPQGYDGTGAPQFKSNEHFTGVYLVKRITHKFEGGQFKQSVEASRSPLIDVFKAFGYRDQQDEFDKRQAKIEAAANEKAAAEKKAAAAKAGK